MILDKNGKPIEANQRLDAQDIEYLEQTDQMVSFEDYNGDTFEALHGDSDQVLMDAFALDTGRAVTESDLATEGTYVLYEEEGCVVLAERSKLGEVNVRVNVMPWKWDKYKQELRVMKDAWNINKQEEGPVWHCPAFVLGILQALYDVHPYWDEQEFEKVLAREMPEAWIRTDKMPLY